MLSRSTSVEPEQMKASPKERIIPISFENTGNREPVQSPPAKPPVARGFQTQKSTQSQRFEIVFKSGYFFTFLSQVEQFVKTIDSGIGYRDSRI